MDYLGYLEGPKVTTPEGGVTYLNPLHSAPGLVGDNIVRDASRRPTPIKTRLFNPPLFGNLATEAFAQTNIRTSARQCWDSSLSDSVQRAFSFTPTNIPPVPTAPVPAKKSCLKRPGESSAPKKSVGFKAGLAFDITNDEHVPQSTLSQEEWHARTRAASRLRKANEAELRELELIL